MARFYARIVFESGYSTVLGFNGMLEIWMFHYQTKVFEVENIIGVTDD